MTKITPQQMFLICTLFWLSFPIHLLVETSFYTFIFQNYYEQKCYFLEELNKRSAKQAFQEASNQSSLSEEFFNEIGSYSNVEAGRDSVFSSLKCVTILTEQQVQNYISIFFNTKFPVTLFRCTFYISIYAHK